MSDPNGLKWSECPKCKDSGIHEDSECCYCCKAELCPKCKDFTMKQFERQCPKCKTEWCSECGEFEWTSDYGCKNCGFKD